MIMMNPDIEIWAKWSKHVNKSNISRKPIEIIPKILEEKCRIEEFFKKHPEEKVCMLSCTCSKCSVHC